jgi:hypothetical protein
MKKHHHQETDTQSLTISEDLQAVIFAALVILLAALGLLGPTGIAITF